MEQRTIGNQIKDTREELGLTQEELALRCRVHVRTIQGIESGELSPRMYTIRLINDALGTNFIIDKGFEETDAEIKQFRESFKKRKSTRIILIFTTIALLIGITIIAYPSWELFGMPKLSWAPFFYLFMFGIISSSAFIWRCPACKGQLGDVFNTKYCSKCGMNFDD